MITIYPLTATRKLRDTLAKSYNKFSTPQVDNKVHKSNTISTTLQNMHIDIK